jgi:hypothetical protein
LPFDTARSRLFASAARTRSTLSVPRATNVTSYPDFANTSTIPVAIVPDPTTPTLATGRRSPPAAPAAPGVRSSPTTVDDPGSA